jgi:hypothetical protein
MSSSPTRARPGPIALLLLGYLGLALLFERHTDAAGVLALGVVTWLVLLAAVEPLGGEIRARAAAVVAVASAGEVLGSLVLGLYAYRRGGIPLFVPPGHGLVYLTGHHLARTRLLTRRPRATVRVAAAGAAAWAALGLLAGVRPDVAGAIWMAAFLAFLWRGPEPALFAAMLLVVALLELYGTSLGAWTWVAHWPVTGLPAGNPPSGVAAGYCLFDAAALRLAPWLLRRAAHASDALRRGGRPAYVCACCGGPMCTPSAG